MHIFKCVRRTLLKAHQRATQVISSVAHIDFIYQIYLGASGNATHFILVSCAHKVTFIYSLAKHRYMYFYGGNSLYITPINVASVISWLWWRCRCRTAHTSLFRACFVYSGVWNVNIKSWTPNRNSMRDIFRAWKVKIFFFRIHSSGILDIHKENKRQIRKPHMQKYISNKFLNIKVLLSCTFCTVDATQYIKYI